MTESLLIGNRPNGSTVKLLYWIMGAMFSVILVSGGYTLNVMSDRINTNTSELATLKQTVYIRGERIAVLESKLSSSEFRLERMEGKLDKLLENMPSRRN